MPPGGSGRSTTKTTTKTLLKTPEPINQKDDEELQLERLVFGDDEGFRAALKTYDSDDFNGGGQSSSDDDEEIEPEPGEDLDAIADDDVGEI